MFAARAARNTNTVNHIVYMSPALVERALAIDAQVHGGARCTYHTNPIVIHFRMNDWTWGVRVSYSGPFQMSMGGPTLIPVSAHAPVKRAEPAYISRAIRPTHAASIIGVDVAGGKLFFGSLSLRASARLMRVGSETRAFAFGVANCLVSAVERTRAVR